MLKKHNRICKMMLTFFAIAITLIGSCILVSANNNVIDSVTVKSVPVAAFEESIADAKATFAETEGCIAESYWTVWDASAGEYGEFVRVSDGTFTKTDIYQFCMKFSLEDGYTFAKEGLTINYADGIDVEKIEEWAEGEGEDAAYYSTMPVLSFAAPIYEIYVTLPEVEAGNIASVGEAKFRTGDTNISNENFGIKAYWECPTDNYANITGQKFEAEKGYQYCFEVTAKEGCYFADSLTIYCNGEEVDAYNTSTVCEMYLDFTTCTPLEVIELAGLPAKEVGAVMVDTLENLSDEENFEVGIDWYDAEENDVTGKVMEDGKAYVAYIEVHSIGYIPLSEDLIIAVDGVEYHPTFLYTDSNEAFLELQYNFTGTGITPVPDKDDTNVNKDNADKSGSSASAKTGDSSMVMLWLAIAVLSMGTVLFVRRKFN